MKKETIVFVHGARHGKWCWDKFFKPAFMSNGYEVVTFNLPGHDQSGRIKGINKFGIRDYVRSLEDQVKRLDTPPIIIGHSMGGLVVQKFLETNTCSKAILLASVPPYGVIKTTLRILRNPRNFWALITRNLYLLVNSVEKSKALFFSKELANEDVEEYSRKLCSESYTAFLNMLLPRVKINYHLKIPLLVIGANDDTIFLKDEIKDSARRYNADLMMFDNIAHDMMLDIHHEQVSKEIIRWIEKSPDPCRYED